MSELNSATLAGGAWLSEAMKNIQAFMEKAVQGLNVIA